jgi:uncharacterized protein (TIGR03437 family)
MLREPCHRRQTHGLIPPGFARGTILLSLCLANLQGSTPLSTYGTYFGGAGDESGTAVTTDSQGNLIIAGSTTSQSLPGTSNAFQRNLSVGPPNNQDAFVAKFDVTGRKLLWTTFLGGDGGDTPIAVATDQAGDVFVIGTTTSSNFPIQRYISCSGTTTSQQACSATPPPTPGTSLGFLAKLSSDGSRLIYSVGLTGVSQVALGVDAQGSAYVAELTVSGNGFYLFHLDSTGTLLISSIFLGSGGGGTVASATLDPQGHVWVAGFVFPGGTGLKTTANALQTQQSNEGIAPGPNGFIFEINSLGFQILYGTYFGPRYSNTSIDGLVIASDGSAYFDGATDGTTLQATPGAYLSSGKGYVAKLRPGASTLDSFSYLAAPAFGLVLGSDQTLRLVDRTAYQNGAFEYVVLTTPILGLVGLAPTFYANALAQASPPQAVWTLGPSNIGFVDQFITPDAYQSKVNGPSDAIFQEITLISPAISVVRNAASLATGNVAPGELISVFGSELGPPVGVSGAVGPNNVVLSTLGGVQALFDGVPAPLFFVRADQVNTVVPFGVAGRAATQLVIQYQGALSSPVSLSVQNSQPGIFTANGSGQGQAAALNQDFTVNSPSNPAQRGTAFSLYVTGAGQTSPPLTDGQIAGTNLSTTVLPVIVGVANAGVSVLYSGAAPGLVAGVIQINAQVPDDAPVGSAVPIAVQVGNTFAPAGVTIAIK